MALIGENRGGVSSRVGSVTSGARAVSTVSAATPVNMTRRKRHGEGHYTFRAWYPTQWDSGVPLFFRLTGDTSHHKRGDRQCLINLLAKKGLLLAASLVVMLTRL